MRYYHLEEFLEKNDIKTKEVPGWNESWNNLSFTYKGMNLELEGEVNAITLHLEGDSKSLELKDYSNFDDLFQDLEKLSFNNSKGEVDEDEEEN